MPSMAVGEFLDRRRRCLGDLANAVLIAQQMGGLLIEYLPGDLARLVQDLAAVLCVGVIAEVGPLVEEALACGVDDDAERVAVLLEPVTDRKVAELRGIAVPGDRVAAGPVARGGGAGFEGHLDAVAGVVPRAPDLGEVPARAEVAGPPFGVGLEAAGGEHDRVGIEVDNLAVGEARHAANDMPVVGVLHDQVQGTGFVMHPTPIRSASAKR